MSLSEQEFRVRSDEALDGARRALLPLADEEGLRGRAAERRAQPGVRGAADAKFVVSPNAPVRQIWVSAMARSYKLAWAPEMGAFALDGETLPALARTPHPRVSLTLAEDRTPMSAHRAGKKAPAFTPEGPARQDPSALRLRRTAGRAVLLSEGRHVRLHEGSLRVPGQPAAVQDEQGGGARRQHPGRGQQGEVREEVRPDVSAARRRRSRGRGEVRRLAEAVALRPVVHGHRAHDVPDRRPTARWRSGGTR